MYVKKASVGILGFFILFFSDINAHHGKYFEIPSKLGTSNFVYEYKDLKLILSGAFRPEHFFYDNMSTLNKRLPDEQGVFKQTVDLNFDLIGNFKKEGHSDFEFFVALRNKDYWGSSNGYYLNFDQATEKDENYVAAGHNHNLLLWSTWVRELWFEFCINSALKLENKNLNFFKLGWFPFALGNGIALDSSYHVYYDDFGYYTDATDKFVPGINFYGEIIKGKLLYDIYYAKYRDKSASLLDVFNGVKKDHVKDRFRPYRGIAKDDEAWAFALQWKPFENKKYGKLHIEPYIYYSEGSDRPKNIKNEVKAEIGAYGFALDYSKNNIEFGCELVANYGQEIYAELDLNKQVIDVRNKNSYIKDSNAPDYIYQMFGTNYPNYLDPSDPHVFKKYLSSNPDLYQYFSHICYVDDNSVNAPVNDLIRKAGLDNIYLPAGVAYKDAGHGENKLTNRPERIRPEFTCKLRGWAGLLSLAYTPKKINVKLAAEVAYASGDLDQTIEPKDKTFNGFIGLREYFQGKNVNSLLVLGERQLSIPYSLPPNYSKPVILNYSFSDMKYLGVSLTWSPESLKKRNFKMGPNFLWFWKNSKSYMYDRALDRSSSTEIARKFLGTELNFALNFDLIKDLNFVAIASVFLPGGFYKDVRGVKVVGIPFVDDLVINPGNLVPAEYRLGADRAIFTDIFITYKF